MSKLTEEINQAIKDAMRAKEKAKLAALRDIKSKIMTEATAGRGEVDEAKENKIVVKLYKQRMDAYQLYKEQGREDLAKPELYEAGIIEQFMPQLMGEEEILAKVKEAISQLGASSPKDIGKVMGKLTKELAGKADGKVIAQQVKAELNK